jgi:hypothetical protein
MVLRHYASVPTNLFQISALAYGALNEFPQSKESTVKTNAKVTIIENYGTSIFDVHLSREEDQQLLPPPNPPPCPVVIPAYPLPPPLHIVV